MVIQKILKLINKQVGTEHCSVPTTNPNYGMLSKVIKSFKEITFKKIREQFHNTDFKWQRSFYDHIIGNEKSLYKIREYIRNNPLKWELSHGNLENLIID
jgi:putative transposase